MTDRELLEAAAKAAGLDHLWVAEIDGIRPEWNPLTDDGDALRLAVTLKLLDDVNYSLMVGDHDWSDHFAATRRAIVCAAAALVGVRPNVKVEPHLSA